MYYVEVITTVITGQDKRGLIYHSSVPVESGSLVRIPLGQKVESGVVIGPADKPAYPTKAVASILPIPLPKPYVDFLLWLAAYYATPAPVVFSQALPTDFYKLLKPPGATSAPPKSTRAMGELKLSLAQDKVVAQILARPSGLSLLHGDTGSGKTLIYREVAKQTVAEGKSVLILIPEIGLSQQVVDDFKDIAPNTFVTHSGLTDLQRRRIWMQILQQEPPYLVVGPRSSLFSPIQQLGLVVVDEAHENTYKNDSSPRYETQIAASYLARLHQARIILGTATPRISDYYLATAKGYPLLKLSAHSLDKASVKVIDQRSISDFTQSKLISDSLLLALKDTLSKKLQSLLYLNRRGTSSSILCSQCGWSDSCPRCGVNLSLHHDLGLAICHQCGFKKNPPVSCPSCGSADVVYRGIGTKRVEAELIKLIPHARLARFDSDSVKGQRLAESYSKVHDGEVDIIIGTQSVAKGLDLPKLHTVGVVSADSELYLPDFTAAERSFQLLYQVIGRAGRSGGGQAFIQTRNPEHPAISYAVKRDYAGFYQQELASRSQHAYPPFSYLLGLVYKSTSRDKASKGATAHATELKRKSGLSVLGPAPAYLEKQGRYYRWLVVVKSRRRALLLEIAQQTRAKRNWQIDLDPTNLLY